MKPRPRLIKDILPKTDKEWAEHAREAYDTVHQHETEFMDLLDKLVTDHSPIAGLVNSSLHSATLTLNIAAESRDSKIFNMTLAEMVKILVARSYVVGLMQGTSGGERQDEHYTLEQAKRAAEYLGFVLAPRYGGVCWQCNTPLIFTSRGEWIHAGLDLKLHEHKAEVRL